MVKLPMTARVRRAMIVTLASLGLLSAACVKAGASQAELRQACAKDARTVCAGVRPGGGRIKQCMFQRFDQLSDACKNAMESAGLKQ